MCENVVRRRDAAIKCRFSAIRNIAKNHLGMIFYSKWRPHRDSNADLKLRRLLFYPVKLWGLRVLHYTNFFETLTFIQKNICKAVFMSLTALPQSHFPECWR